MLRIFEAHFRKEIKNTEPRTEKSPFLWKSVYGSWLDTVKNAKWYFSDRKFIFITLYSFLLKTIKMKVDYFDSIPCSMQNVGQKPSSSVLSYSEDWSTQSPLTIDAYLIP